MSNDSRTFRDLDGNVDLPVAYYPLPKWYDQIRDTPIVDLLVGDLARAIRQDIFVVEIMPTCLSLLRHHPLTGDMIDGELLLACIRLKDDFWSGRLTELAILCKVIAFAEDRQTGDGIYSPDQDLSNKGEAFKQKYYYAESADIESQLGEIGRPYADGPRTIRDLDENKVPCSVTTTLAGWYDSIRDVSLEDLYIGDLAMALRNGILVIQLLPLSISVVRHDPFAGHSTMCELFLACMNVHAKYKHIWPHNTELLCRLGKHVVEKSYQPESSELVVRVREFLSANSGDNGVPP